MKPRQLSAVLTLSFLVVPAFQARATPKPIAVWPCQSEQIQQEREKLENRDPAGEARISVFESGDYRFMALKVDSLLIPGLDDTQASCVIARRAYRTLKDMSTMLRCQEYTALVDAATVFAEQYNQFVLDARQGDGLGVCDGE